MVTLCEKLGPGRLLSGVKDITDKVLPAVKALCHDPSPETRSVSLSVRLIFMDVLIMSVSLVSVSVGVFILA